MMLIRYTADGMRRTVDLNGIFRGRTAILMGASPSIREQPLACLEQRGVLTMAINNAGKHFRPTLWVSGDRPECYEPRLLLDPTIMKFGMASHADTVLDSRYNSLKYHQMPNQYFYMPDDKVSWDEFLVDRNQVPWYSNTLFVGISILYGLGIRRIILGGSDFGFGNDVYAHKSGLGDLERKWNQDLYDSLVFELRRMKPLFDKHGLLFYDCSVNSRIAQTYKHITMPEAIDMCLQDFPKSDVDPATLPHCSKFAPHNMVSQIMNWPGHQQVDSNRQDQKIHIL